MSNLPDSASSLQVPAVSQYRGRSYSEDFERIYQETEEETPLKEKPAKVCCQTS